MSGGGGSTSETQSSGTQAQQSQQGWTPHKAAAPGYGFLAGNMQNLMQKPEGFFPGQTYIGPSQGTQGGLNMLMGGAQAMQPYLGQQGQNYQFLSNAADVANNPYVQGMLDVNRNQVNQNFAENLLPQINQGAQQVGAMGGSRQGLAQAQGAGRTAQQLANANQQMMNQAYGQGLGAQQYALGQTGNMMQNLQMPGQTMLQGGQIAEQYQQRALQDAMQRFQYQFAEPKQRMSMVQNLLGTLQPMGTGYNNTFGQNQNQSTTNTQQQQSGMGMMQQGLGLMGSIAPLLMMSDRRLKKNIKRAGSTPAGYALYDFDFIGGVRGHGVMADEVPSEWVVRRPDGYLMVDYSQVR